MKKRRKEKKTSEEKKKQADTLSFIAIVFGVISCILCCVRVVGLVFAALAIILAITAMISGGRKGLAAAAICVAVLAAGFNIAAISAVTDFLGKFGSDSSNSYNYGF